MKNLLKVLLVFCMSLNFAFAAKVLKVKGSKAYLSRKGLKRGKSYKVYADGYEVGKVKVLKIKGKYAIAKIIDGAIGKGDVVKSKKRRKKRSGRRSSRTRGSSKSSFGIYAGLGYNLLGQLSDIGYELASTPSLNFGVDYKVSKNMTLMTNFNYTFGGAIKLSESEVESEFSLWELNSDLAYFFTPSIYVKAGLGLQSLGTQLQLISTNTTSALGDYNNDYFGYNVGLGAGYIYDFSNKINFKFDITYRLHKYFSAELNEPTNVQSGNPGESGSNLSLLFLAGFKF